MRGEGLRAQVGYKRRPGKYGTKPAVVAANQLQQDFNVDAPDTVWGEPARHRFEGFPMTRAGLKHSQSVEFATQRDVLVSL